MNPVLLYISRSFSYFFVTPFLSCLDFHVTYVFYKPNFKCDATARSRFRPSTTEVIRRVGLAVIEDVFLFSDTCGERYLTL